MMCKIILTQENCFHQEMLKKLGAVVHRTVLLKNLSYSPDINTAETLAIWLHSVFCMLFINNTHRSGFSNKIQK